MSLLIKLYCIIHTDFGPTLSTPCGVILEYVLFYGVTKTYYLTKYKKKKIKYIITLLLHLYDVYSIRQILMCAIKLQYFVFAKLDLETVRATDGSCISSTALKKANIIVQKS